MRLYAQTPARRTSQLIGDVAVLGWCVVWILVARAVHGLVEQLAGPGRTLEGAGRDLSSSMREASGVVGDVPVAGDALRAPFDLAGDVGTRIQNAGLAQQDAVSTLAVWLAIVLAAIPITWALWRWVPARLTWMREATAAQAMIDDVELFAVRALAHRPLRELATLGPAPAAAWKAGDPTATAALARLELASLGLRLPGGLQLPADPRLP
ncbi:hypothetical protein BH18ACT7_BH18ACT7_11330 [soil metagenome]